MFPNDKEQWPPQVIDGKRYNTETAELLGDRGNGLGLSDFHSWKEWLYRTSKGAYFLAGEGGALSSWSQSSGDGRCAGDGIRPITESEAREWLEAEGNYFTATICRLFEVEDA